jgi:hypothetical protein
LGFYVFNELIQYLDAIGRYDTQENNGIVVKPLQHSSYATKPLRVPYQRQIKPTPKDSCIFTKLIVLSC